MYGYQPEPSAVLAGFGASLVITLIAYGVFPLFFALLRNEEISKKKYTWTCFGVNAAVMVVFIAVGSNGGGYVLWTWIFSAIGKKILDSRYKLESEYREESRTSYYEENKKRSEQERKADSTETAASPVYKKVDVNSEKPEFVEIDISEEYVICPHCGTRQFSNRKMCFNCAVCFEAKNDNG